MIGGARILALGGVTASALTMLGGFAGWPGLVGAAGAIMLLANVAVLAGAGREWPARRAVGRGSAVVENCTTNSDIVCIARSDP